MHCDNVWDLLSVYADGEATQDEAAIVECHVATCSACANDLEFMRGTSAVLQDVPEVEPPLALRQAILAATVNRPTFVERLAATVRRTLAPSPARYGALAAGSAAVALALVASQHGQQPVSPVAYHPASTTPSPLLPGTGTLSLSALPPSTDGEDTGTERLPETPSGRHRSTRFARVAAEMAIHQPHATVGTARRAPAPTVASAGPAVDYRAKVSSRANPDDDPTPEDPVVPPADDSAGSATAVAAAHTTIEPTSGRASLADEGAGRVQLVASAAPVSAEQVTTLADLKRSLRHQVPPAAAEIKRAQRDHEIRVDVLRGSF